MGTNRFFTPQSSLATVPFDVKKKGFVTAQ